MKTLGDVARMTTRLPDELAKAQRRGVQRGALHVTRGIRDEVRAATGGDMKLSGVGRKGARVGAKYTLGGGSNPTALIKATGPMQLLEHNTRPHIIKPRKRRGAKALALRGGGFAAAVRHPGTTAKKPFEKGYLKTRGDTGRIYDREIQAGIRGALR